MTERSERVTEEASFHPVSHLAQSLRLVIFPFFLCPFVLALDGLEFYVCTGVLIQAVDHLVPVPAIFGFRDFIKGFIHDSLHVFYCPKIDEEYRFLERFFQSFKP